MTRIRRSWTMALAVAVAGAGAAPHAAGVAQSGGPGSDYALVVEGAGRLEAELRTLGDQGYSCTSIARPDAPLMPTVVTVLLARTRGEASARPVEHRVVRGRIPRDLAEVERGVNDAAGTGFALCGLTVATSAPLIGPGADEYVAVLTRSAATDDTGERVRLLHSRGHADDWRGLVAAGKEGYLPAPAVWRPLPDRPAEAEVIYVARRSGASAPVEIVIATAGADDTLQRAIARHTAAGYRIHAAFTGNEWLNVLMTRRPGGPPPDEVDYMVEITAASGPFRVSPFYGRLIRMLPFRNGGRVALYDRRRTGRYDVRTWEMPADASRSGSAPRQRARIQDDINVRFGDGDRPVDLLVRARSGPGVHTLEAIFELAPGR